MARTRRKTRWFCTRQSKGVKCNTWNPIRKQTCHVCGKAKPAVKKPKHMAALNESYEHYIEINGGEHCGICGITRAQTKDPSRKLNRDHFHEAGGMGAPRGLLCTGDNLKLQYWMTIPWMEAALDYLRRHEARMADLRAITDDDWEGEEVA
jgi:hypothetical protein